MSSYCIPESKKHVLTQAFLTDLLLEINRLFNLDQTATIQNDYDYISATGGFHEALRLACKKHNLTQDIYEYSCGLDWQASDRFDEFILSKMHHLGLIH